MAIGSWLRPTFEGAGADGEEEQPVAGQLRDVLGEEKNAR